MLDTGVGSDTSRVEEPVQGAPLVAGRRRRRHGAAAKARASSGVVTDARGRRRSKAARTSRCASTRSRRAATTSATDPDGGDRTHGGGDQEEGRGQDRRAAAGGAIIGAIVGGKKGAAIGTAVGGGAGTAVVLVDARRGSASAQGRGADAAVVRAGDDSNQDSDDRRRGLVSWSTLTARCFPDPSPANPDTRAAAASGPHAQSRRRAARSAHLLRLPDAVRARRDASAFGYQPYAARTAERRLRRRPVARRRGSPHRADPDSAPRARRTSARGAARPTAAAGRSRGSACR